MANTELNFRQKNTLTLPLFMITLSKQDSIIVCFSFPCLYKKTWSIRKLHEGQLSKLENFLFLIWRFNTLQLDFLHIFYQKLSTISTIFCPKFNFYRFWVRFFCILCRILFLPIFCIASIKCKIWQHSFSETPFEQAYPLLHKFCAIKKAWSPFELHAWW